MADQRDRRDQERDQRTGNDQTVVIPAVQWPSAEPDAPTAPHSGHIDYLDTPDGPMQAPPDGVYSPPSTAIMAANQTRSPDATATLPTGSRPAGGGPSGGGQMGSGPGQGGQVGGGPMGGGPVGGSPDGGSPDGGGPGGGGPSGGGQVGDRDHGGPVDGGPEGGPAEGQAGGPWYRRLPMRRIALVGAAVIGALALLYGVDLVLASGKVPRGVTVAGVEVGGLDRAAAEQRLHEQVDPRLSQPVEVQAGDVRTDVDPAEAGLSLDWSATLDQAGDQPLNPFTRLRSLFAEREVGVVTRADQVKLGAVLSELEQEFGREPTEGTVRFDGVTPVPVDPVPGQRLDVPKAADVLVREWASGRPVELPASTVAVRSTPESVRAALEGIAMPAVSGPVKVIGEGGEATLTPEVIAGALTFEVAEDGSLTPKYDNDKITEALRPQLAKTEKPGKDATVVIEGGQPVVKPSVDGHGVDWAKSLATLPDVLRNTANRELTATYDHQPAKFTTEQANGLGIREVIGEFTTRGFASDSGVNIRVIANEVNGALVKPGEQFSLNTYTGPRGTAQGYIEAGIIDKGRPGRAVGGGCSQFTTTLYNAAYFAGMTDVAHKEHSYYISRYPEAREATIFDGLIDLVFRNDAPTGALIETAWTPSSITVRIWGTKHYEVESITGGRSNFTEPNTVTIPHGEKCTPGNGAQGFTVSNTRIVRDARTKAELKRNTHTVVYNPVPKIVCEPPPPG